MPQDDAKAAEWYKLAADRGDREAMFALAMFRLAGRGGPRDRDASAKLLAAAAKLGQPLAAYDLALLYIEGQLFPQDFNRAAELLRASAQAGNPEAQYALGTITRPAAACRRTCARRCTCWPRRARRHHRRGGRIRHRALQRRRHAKNQEAAAALFKKAALKGGAVAQDRLAHILSTGQGAPANPADATKWHLISKAGGETDSSWTLTSDTPMPTRARPAKPRRSRGSTR